MVIFLWAVWQAHPWQQNTINNWWWQLWVTVTSWHVFKFPFKKFSFPQTKLEFTIQKNQNYFHKQPWLVQEKCEKRCKVLILTIQYFSACNSNHWSLINTDNCYLFRAKPLPKSVLISCLIVLLIYYYAACHPIASGYCWDYNPGALSLTH